MLLQAAIEVAGSKTSRYQLNTTPMENIAKACFATKRNKQGNKAMRQFTATLYSRKDGWYFEATIEAKNLTDARRQAQRDYADKTTKVVSVVSK